MVTKREFKWNRKIGGKNYKIQNFYSVKAEANTRAGVLKRQGKSVRILKVTIDGKKTNAIAVR